MPLPSAIITPTEAATTPILTILVTTILSALIQHITTNHTGRIKGITRQPGHIPIPIHPDIIGLIRPDITNPVQRIILLPTAQVPIIAQHMP